MSKHPHSECAGIMRRTMAALGSEVNASEWRPGMVMPKGFDDCLMECPHGVRMWMEPTIEQRLRWQQERTL